MPFDSKSQRYLYPHPTKRGVLVSRQRIYQLQRLADGVCGICGSKRLCNSEMCGFCRRAHNARRRAKYRAEATDAH